MYSNKLFANNNTALWDLVAKYTINIRAASARAMALKYGRPINGIIKTRYTII